MTREMNVVFIAPHPNDHHVARALNGADVAFCVSCERWGLREWAHVCSENWEYHLWALAERIGSSTEEGG